MTFKLAKGVYWKCHLKLAKVDFAVKGSVCLKASMVYGFGSDILKSWRSRLCSHDWLKDLCVFGAGWMGRSGWALIYQK